MRYRKKPVVIDAYRYTIDSEVPEWFTDMVNKRQVMPHEDGTCTIETLEGTMLGSYGDYIVRGIDGEPYPCKPDIFQKTYEPVYENGTEDWDK